MREFLDALLGIWLLFSAIMAALFAGAGIFMLLQLMENGVSNNFELIIALVSAVLIGVGFIILNQIVNIAKTNTDKT